jgi:hypothetical protein
MIEQITHKEIKYAEIIRADFTVKKTAFFPPSESSFQFGLLASVQNDKIFINTK